MKGQNSKTPPTSAKSTKRKDGVQYKKRAWMACLAMDREMWTASVLAGRLCILICDRYSEDERRAEFGDRYLAKLLGCDNGGIKRARRHAKQHGWINYTPGSGRGRRTLYSIHLDDKPAELKARYAAAKQALSMLSRDAEEGAAASSFEGEEKGAPTPPFEGEEKGAPTPPFSRIKGGTKRPEKGAPAPPQNLLPSEPITKKVNLPLSRQVEKGKEGKAGGSNALAKAEAVKGNSHRALGGEALLRQQILADDLNALAADDIPPRRALEIFQSLYPKHDRDPAKLAIAFKRACKKWPPKHLAVVALLWRIYRERYPMEFIPLPGKWLAQVESKGINLPSGCNTDSMNEVESALAGGTSYSDICYIIGSHMASVFYDDILASPDWDDQEMKYAGNAWCKLRAAGHKAEDIRDNLKRYTAQLPKERPAKPGKWKKRRLWLLAKVLAEEPWKTLPSVH
jgi:hypothetical protein